MYLDAFIFIHRKVQSEEKADSCTKLKGELKKYILLILFRLCASTHHIFLLHASNIIGDLGLQRSHICHLFFKRVIM